MAIGVQVTFDAHDPGRFAVFWAEARVHRATTTARLCDLARLRPAHRAAGGTVERLRRPRRPGWGRATAVLPARAQGQECDEPGAPGPQHRRHGVRPRAASLPSAPSGRSSSPTLAAPCCVRWTSTSPRRCALLDKHGAVTRPRDGIPLAGSEGHRARRARHPCGAVPLREGDPPDRPGVNLVLPQ